MADRPYRLLFVCSGNICRSPMAEVIAQAYAARRGRPAEVRSAGTLGLDGQPASENSVVAVGELGLDLTRHVSQGVRTAHVDWADYIAVMEVHHAQWLRDRYPELEGKVVLLGSFAGQMNISDPMGRSLREYRHARDLISAGIERFVDAMPPAGPP